MSGDRYETLILGTGAIGSRLALRLDGAFTTTCVDAERVGVENVGVAAFEPGDVGKPKADVVAGRRRADGAGARAITGDIRYVVRPGLVRALESAALCLDNARAIRDAADAAWGGAGDRPIPVVALTCGGAAGGWQARVFVSNGVCPVCLYGEADRRADVLAESVSCADTSAPRASADAAEAAARAGADILARWRDGDRSLAGRRLQCDAGGEPFVIRMPDAIAERCPVAHRRPGAAVDDVESLGGTVSAVTVGTLAERALARVGRDADLLLGRRGIPTAGLYCPSCSSFAPALPRLLPAAIAAARLCECDLAPRPLGLRDAIGARELLGSGIATLTLAAWGAAPGDEIVAAGSRRRVRLACDFDWSEL